MNSHPMKSWVQRYHTAILLGITFKVTPSGWQFVLPGHMELRGQTYLSGHYQWRSEAVDVALKLAGVDK